MPSWWPFGLMILICGCAVVWIGISLQRQLNDACLEIIKLQRRVNDLEEMLWPNRRPRQKGGGSLPSGGVEL